MSARGAAVLDAVARSLAAALGAALAAGAIVGLFNARDGDASVFLAGAISIGSLVAMVAFLVALAHVLLLGLPFALLLRRLRRDTLPMMTAGGAIIGAVPVTLLDNGPFLVAMCAACGAAGAAAFHFAGLPTRRSDASR